MIQATLIFLLGFLAAVFLAALVAPAIWRRAVKLTRRRVEAALPLSMGEIRADKDAVRAEYAMATRKLEVTVKALKEEIAAQALALDRAGDEARRLGRERDEGRAQIAALETRKGALKVELLQGEKENMRLAALVAERDRLLAEQAAEIERLGVLYDDASFAASSRQIELVAQEAKLDETVEEAAAQRAARAEAEARLREAGTRIRELEQAARGEKRKVVALERKAGKLTASLSDAEEKLERRERDLARLRGRLKEGDAEPEGAALLRERIGDLAAEMVSLTAALEGPDSPIHTALAAEPQAGEGEPGGLSLAARIRAAQKAAGRG